MKTSAFRPIAALDDRALVRIVFNAQKRTGNMLNYTSRERLALRELSRRVWRGKTSS